MTLLLGAVALHQGLWLLLDPLPTKQPWAGWLPHLGKDSPTGKTLLWEKPKSPRTSEGFFSFCRDQGDLVFGILEHLEVDVV